MENYYVLNNIIKQGFDNGYMKDLVKDASNKNLEMTNDRWMLGGFDIGSTWSIIFNPDFAKIIWGDDYQSHMTNLVVMQNQDRINYLRQFVKSEEDKVVREKVETKAPVDALMSAIQDSQKNLKETSMLLFNNVCNDCYNDVRESVSKASMTQLTESDHIKMNGTDMAMNGGLAKFLNQNGKASFTVCPDCGVDDFTHTEGCSIYKKTNDWLFSQNEGC